MTFPEATSYTNKHSNGRHCRYILVRTFDEVYLPLSIDSDRPASQVGVLCVHDNRDQRATVREAALQRDRGWTVS